MAINYRIVIPGAGFKNAMDKMRERLAQTIDAQSEVPVRLFFEYFDLTAENSSLKAGLWGRGSFATHDGRVYSNRGPDIDETIRNIGPELDEAQLYVPSTLDVETKSSSGQLGFKFVGELPLIELAKIPPELGLGTRFVLNTIDWTTAGALYLFSEEATPENTLELFVDVSQSARSEMFRNDSTFRFGLSTRMRLMSTALLRDNSCCHGLVVDDPPVPSGRLCFKIHAKILVSPTILVSEQIAALNATYAAADIHAELSSVEPLTLPVLEGLDVGQCRTDTLTQEQATLFGNRNNASANDMCVYWVASLDSPLGSLNGCASHPYRVWAVALVTATTRYCLAHEIAHVFGLHHKSETSQPAEFSQWIMNRYDYYTDPPPDLSPSEIEIMRRTGFRAGILSSC